MLNSSSGGEDFVTIYPDGFKDLHSSPIDDDFVLVEFTEKTEKAKIYFIGKILSKNNSSQEFEIAFMRN